MPGITSVDGLLEWWLTDVRHQFGDDWSDPAAPLLPSERRDRLTGRCTPGRPRGAAGRVGWQRGPLAAGVGGASDPARAAPLLRLVAVRHGVDLKAIQELFGHEWLSTTTGYIHVHAEHIESAWAQANERVAARLAREEAEAMRWNLRMAAAERGIWKSTEMRRRLAEAGLEISAGKMSALWTGTPTTIRLEDLDVICAVLECALRTC